MKNKEENRMEILKKWSEKNIIIGEVVKENQKDTKRNGFIVTKD